MHSYLNNRKVNKINVKIFFENRRHAETVYISQLIKEEAKAACYNLVSKN